MGASYSESISTMEPPQCSGRDTDARGAVLTVFRSVLRLLLYHTQQAAQRAETQQKPITERELRLYLAIRINMVRNLAVRARVRSFRQN